MSKRKRRKYSDEFKEEAVKLIIEQGYSIPSQEAPFVLACSNIDYLRFGNVKFNDKSLTFSTQEED